MDIHRSYFYYDYKKDVTEVEDAIREAAKKRLPTRVKDPLSAPDTPNTILFPFFTICHKIISSLKWSITPKNQCQPMPSMKNFLPSVAHMSTLYLDITFAFEFA